MTVNTSLPAGTYWLDWQTGGTLSSGPWAPPVSILGQTAKPGANGLQFTLATATWGPALDATFQQDLPFVIEGQVPTAVTLAGFDAVAQARNGVITWEMTLLVLTAVGALVALTATHVLRRS